LKIIQQKGNQNMETNTAASRTPTVLSLLAALLIIVIGGWLVGMAVALVGSFFYLAIVFPIGMGFAGGKIASAATEVSRVRKTSQVLLLSVLTAIMIYGAFHYGRYITFQLRVWLELSSSVDLQSEKGVSLKVAKVFADYALREETGHSGFLGYMLYRAKSGLSIGKFYSQNRLNLTSVFAWLYWVLEFGLILWIMNIMAKDYQRIPRCETCGRRLGREQHLGGTTPANEPLLLDLLKRGDVSGLGQMLVKEAGLPSVELYMQKCKTCGQSTSVITVRRATLGRRGVVLSDISKATLPPQEGTLFLQQLSYKLE
jgi:hypothetical protein